MIILVAMKIAKLAILKAMLADIGYAALDMILQTMDYLLPQDRVRAYVVAIKEESALDISAASANGDVGYCSCQPAHPNCSTCKLRCAMRTLHLNMIS